MFHSWLLMFAVAAVAVQVLVILRWLRVPPELERWLQQRGLQPQQMERRWLTRGPFPDIRPAGVKLSGWLFHIRVLDPNGMPASGWVWLPPGFSPSPERWRLHLDPSLDSKPSGIGTPLYAVVLAAAFAAVLLVVTAIMKQHG